jgi:hypothetical protein
MQSVRHYQLHFSSCLARLSVRALFCSIATDPPCYTTTSTTTHAGDTGAADDVELSAIGEFVPQFFTSDHSPPFAERKAGPVSAYAHRGPALNLLSLNHIKPRQYRLAMSKPRTRLDVSQQRYCVSAKAYFFFFLPVFFFAAFFAFLAMLPSAIPKLVQCKSTSTCTNTEYTTIAKLILRASKKVNGGHTQRAAGRRASLTMRQRETWARLVAQLENIRPRLTSSQAANRKQLVAEAILLGAIACAPTSGRGSLWQVCPGHDEKREAGMSPRSSELSSLFWRPQLAHQDIWPNPEDGYLLRISGLLPFAPEGSLFHLC